MNLPPEALVDVGKVTVLRLELVSLYSTRLRQDSLLKDFHLFYVTLDLCQAQSDLLGRLEEAGHVQLVFGIERLHLQLLHLSVLVVLGLLLQLLQAVPHHHPDRVRPLKTDSNYSTENRDSFHSKTGQFTNIRKFTKGSFLGIIFVLV